MLIILQEMPYEKNNVIVVDSLLCQKRSKRKGGVALI
jgi:hypothetical protein